jgi:hypothetical protein
MPRLRGTHIAHQASRCLRRVSPRRLAHLENVHKLAISTRNFSNSGFSRYLLGKPAHGSLLRRRFENSVILPMPWRFVTGVAPVAMLVLLLFPYGYLVRPLSRVEGRSLFASSHSRKPPRNALALSPLLQLGGRCLSFLTLPPPRTTSSGWKASNSLATP